MPPVGGVDLEANLGVRWLDMLRLLLRLENKERSVA